jgi:outer membrane protein OmpA-like peptidoglycan-associated protein
MNKSDKVLLYGSLFSIFFIVFCVISHKDKILEIKSRGDKKRGIEVNRDTTEAERIIKATPTPTPIQTTKVEVPINNQVEITRRMVEEVEEIIEPSATPTPIEESSIDDILSIQDKISNILKENRISFYRSSSQLRLDSKRTLDKILEILDELPSVELVVKGYTDASGSKAKNRVLSLKRAEAVKRYLVERGFNPEDIEAIGYGEEDLIDEKNPYNPINRRVEIEIRR